MIEHLYEYFVTDLYYLLWMVSAESSFSAGNGHFKSAMSIVYKEDFNEGFLTAFDDPDDIPGSVLLTDWEHNTKGTEGFHSTRRKASIKARQMKLVWGETEAIGEAEDHVEKIIRNPYRENGPAVVVLEGLQKWHKDGNIHRASGNGKNPAIKCEFAKFRWFTKEPGKMYRSCGPFELTLNDIKIFHDETKEIPPHKKFTFSRIGFRWNTHGGTVITERNAYQALNSIACGETDKYNLLSTGDSIFLESVDEFLFWQEVDVD